MRHMSIMTGASDAGPARYAWHRGPGQSSQYRRSSSPERIAEDRVYDLRAQTRHDGDIPVANQLFYMYFLCPLDPETSGGASAGRFRAHGGGSIPQSPCQVPDKFAARQPRSLRLAVGPTGPGSRRRSRFHPTMPPLAASKSRRNHSCRSSDKGSGLDCVAAQPVRYNDGPTTISRVERVDPIE